MLPRFPKTPNITELARERLYRTLGKLMRAGDVEGAMQVYRDVQEMQRIAATYNFKWALWRGSIRPPK